MTVKELLERLEYCDPSLPVVWLDGPGDPLECLYVEERTDRNVYGYKRAKADKQCLLLVGSNWEPYIEDNE